MSTPGIHTNLSTRNMGACAIFYPLTGQKRADDQTSLRFHSYPIEAPNKGFSLLTTHLQSSEGLYPVCRDLIVCQCAWNIVGFPSLHTRRSVPVPGNCSCALVTQLNQLIHNLAPTKPSQPRFVQMEMHMHLSNNHT